MYKLVRYYIVYNVLLCIILGCNNEPKRNHNSNSFGLLNCPDYCIPKTYSIQQLPNPPVIDGVIDKQEWGKIPWSSPFVSELKNGSTENAFTTKFKIGKSKDSLFFAALVYDPHIWGVNDLCESYFFDDNFIELYVDDDNDEFDYAVLKVNALGKFCGEYRKRNYDKPIARFSLLENSIARCKVDVEGTVNNPKDIDDYWTVECAIPLNLKIDSIQVLNPQTSWNVNVQRKQWPYSIVGGLYKKMLNPETGKKYQGEQWVWSFMNENSIHTPELWGQWIFDSSQHGSEGLNRLQLENQIKWELRNIYYAQQIHHQKHNRYAHKVAGLKDIGLKLSELKYKPNINACKNRFVAFISDEKSSSSFFINQEGKVWIEP